MFSAAEVVPGLLACGGAVPVPLGLGDEVSVAPVAVVEDAVEVAVAGGVGVILAAVLAAVDRVVEADGRLARVGGLGISGAELHLPASTHTGQPTSHADRKVMSGWRILLLPQKAHQCASTWAQPWSGGPLTHASCAAAAGSTAAG